MLENKADRSSQMKLNDVVEMQVCVVVLLQALDQLTGGLMIKRLPRGPEDHT